MSTWPVGGDGLARGGRIDAAEVLLFRIDTMLLALSWPDGMTTSPVER
jgi:hypothetical protein